MSNAFIIKHRCLKSITMKIQRLQHLVTLAESCNFHKAAELCHITQPAFTRSIQAAEAEYGLQLFDRSSTGVTCTAAGFIAIERARRVLFENRSLSRDLKLYKDKLIGSLSFGVGPYPAAVIAPSLVIELRNRFPNIQVSVDVNNSEQLAHKVRNEELDFYLADMSNVVADSDLIVQRVSKLTASFYVRAGHPLLKNDHLTSSMMIPFGLAGVRVHKDILIGIGQAMGLPLGEQLQLSVQCDDLSLIKQMGLQTDTVIAYPDAQAAKEVESGRLVKLHIEGFVGPYSDMALTYLKGRTFSPIASFAVDFIKTSFQTG